MQNNKSILIVGNGPSSSYKEAGKLAKGCEVARVNWFFLEKDQIFGKQVDYLFHTSHILLLNYIYFVLNKDDDVYHIINNIDINPNKSRRVKNVLQNQMAKIDRHAPREVSNKSHSLPHESSGLVMLKYFLESGYQTIHIAGMDFYQGKYVYLNKKNAKITELCSRFMKHNRLALGLGAYDVNAHTLEYDINYLSDLLTQYPAVKIIATSCHPETTKIWQQFKQVEVMELSSHQMPEIYDAYLDKQWLRKAVDDFSEKYSGFKTELHRLFSFLRWCKRLRDKHL